MPIRKRKIQANYLEIDKVYEFLGIGFTELNESPGAQTTTKRYINQSSASQSITGYEWTSSFTADQIENEKAIEYIREIGEMNKLGADTETDYLIVDLDKPGMSPNTFRARKRKIAISVDSFDDNDGELGMSGSFLGISDPVEGTFNTQDKTFKEGFTIKTLEFSYQNTAGAITDISVQGITFDDAGDKFKNIPHDTTTFTFKENGTLKTATLGSAWAVK